MKNPKKEKESNRNMHRVHTKWGIPSIQRFERHTKGKVDCLPEAWHATTVIQLSLTPYEEHQCNIR